MAILVEVDGGNLTMPAPGPVVNFSQVGVTHHNGYDSVTFQWDLPLTITYADMAFFDIAHESGFVNYYIQNNQETRQKSIVVDLEPGTYYARVNLHYPGYGDRGWTPSEILQVSVADPDHTTPPPPTGIPAKDLVWGSSGILQWTPAIGNITRVAVDLSSYQDFHDILSAPFVIPHLGIGDIDGLPYAFDLPLHANAMAFNNIPEGEFIYVRVNTLFGDKVWIPSQVLKVQNGVVVEPSLSLNSPYLIAGAIIAVVIFVLSGHSKPTED